MGEGFEATAPPRRPVVVLAARDVAAARELAAAHGVQLRRIPRQGIELVTTVALLLIGAVTAVSTVSHLLEQRRGGQLIDLRPATREQIRRTPDVVYGTVVIITADGTVTVEVKEPDGMFGKIIAMLPKLLSGDSSADEVSRTVTTTFGADVRIEQGGDS